MARQEGVHAVVQVQARHSQGEVRLRLVRAFNGGSTRDQLFDYVQFTYRF